VDRTGRGEFADRDPENLMGVSMNRNASLFVSIAFIASCAVSAVASAEGFIDLRIGGAFTDDNDIELDFGPASLRGETEYEDSVTGGMRAGYWFDSLPWLGLAADVSYFAPDDDTGGPEYDVIPISPLFMARVPIATTEEFPHGRVQPFLGIGPGIFVSLLDFEPVGDDETVEVGVDLHAGLNFQVTPLVSLFVEYRFTYVEPEFEVQGVDITPELSTHHATAGIGFHF
jgi:opacity protein-like surface antigen